MKYLTDVNVICETTKPNRSTKVTDWLQKHRADIWVDPIVVGEIWRGILKLPAGQRRTALTKWFQELCERMPCIEWSLETAIAWAEIVEQTRRAGFTIGIADTMIAATAKLHGLTVATRNVKDFSRCGVPVFDPFV